ncbi:hypothetical protein MMC20_006645 [Loxospora ochrophaea]|nr:hypothetical protein [Loxospora ochrophaea]
MTGLSKNSPMATQSRVEVMPYDKLQRTANGRPKANLSTTQPNGRGPAVAPALAKVPLSYPSPATRKNTLYEPNGTPKGTAKEDIETPVKSFLSSNITPRSGSRKTRIDSASSTPTDTPNGTPGSSRPASFIYQSNHVSEEVQNNGLGIRNARIGRPEKSGSVVSNGNSSMVSFKTASPERSSPQSASPESSAMFFYASDARPSIPTSGTQQRPEMQNRASRFIYANGQEEMRSRGPVSPPVQGMQPRSFPTNGVSEARLASKSTTQTSVSSSSNTSRPLSSKSEPKALPRRSPSPLKDVEVSRKTSISKASPRRHARLKSTGETNSIELRSPTSPRNQSDLSRRSSLNIPASRRISHATTASVESIDLKAGRRRSLCMPPKNPPILDESPSSSFPLAAEPECLAQSANDHMRSPPEPFASPLASSQSPTKPQSKLDHLNELAASARRERKVLDLEISNSSLLAINRTLEREMRKQNAELRRFRRLSRAGRLSNATTNHSTSTRSSGMTRTTNGSDLSEDEDEESLSDLSDYDDSLLEGDDALSPSAQADHAARLRRKDEQMLQLDLSKHQELLIDSQRMNQSLKRCLGLTEELIADGKKALAYHVKVSEVEVGGRVLTPDESELELARGSGLLSPVTEEKAAYLWGEQE